MWREESTEQVWWKKSQGEISSVRLFLEILLKLLLTAHPSIRDLQNIKRFWNLLAYMWFLRRTLIQNMKNILRWYETLRDVAGAEDAEKITIRLEVRTTSCQQFYFCILTLLRLTGRAFVSRAWRQVKAKPSGRYGLKWVIKEAWIIWIMLLLFSTSGRVISFQLPKFHSDSDNFTPSKAIFASQNSKPQLSNIVWQMNEWIIGTHCWTNF